MRFGAVLFAGVAAGSLVVACTVDQSPPCAVQSCPAIDKTAIFVPTGLSSPLVQVSSEGNCIAELTSVDGGDVVPPIFVQVLILTPREARVCQLQGTLADGTQVSATLTFMPVVKGCCDAFNAVATAFTPVDAGADRG